MWITWNKIPPVGYYMIFWNIFKTKLVKVTNWLTGNQQPDIHMYKNSGRSLGANKKQHAVSAVIFKNLDTGGFQQYT